MCAISNGVTTSPKKNSTLKKPLYKNFRLTTSTSVTSTDFRPLMRLAMGAYGLNASHWGKEPLYWYERCSFTSVATSRRETFHIGDYIRLTSGGLALIKQIYTHAFRYEEVRRLFIWCQILCAAPYRDDILQLDVYRVSTTDRIDPLASLGNEKLYIIPVGGRYNSNVSNVDGNPDGPDLLHCSWKINCRPWYAYAMRPWYGYM